MLMWISYLIVSILYSLFYIYIYKKITKNNIKITNVWYVVFIIFIHSLCNLGLFYITDSITAIIIRISIIAIFLYALFSNKFSKICVFSLMLFILFVVGEGVIGSIYLHLFKFKYLLLFENPLVYIIFNSSMLIFVYFLATLKCILYLFDNITYWYEDKKYKVNYVLLFLSIFVLLYLLYKNNSFFINNEYSILTILFMFGAIVLILGYYKENAKTSKISWEYKQLMAYVKDYEKTIDEKSKLQHEYSNQLIVIREMVKRNKTALKYLNEILNQNINDKDPKLLKSLKNVPNGGLKGFIHYKISKMSKKEINIEVYIANIFADKEIISICSKKLEEITKVLGVYLDNAFEAAEKSLKKTVLINLYKEKDKIVFTIANTFKDTIEIDNLNSGNRILKRKNRGYGLLIVNNILEKYRNIDRKTKINGPFFEQQLEIKITSLKK